MSGGKAYSIQSKFLQQNRSGSTAITVTRMFTVEPNDQASIRFVASSPNLVLQADALTVNVTNSSGETISLNGTPGLGRLGVDQVVSDLAAGDYTVTATYTRAGGLVPVAASTLSLEFTGQSITHLDEYVVAGTGSAQGNVLADDTIVSSYTVLKVDTGDGNFVEVIDGMIVNGNNGTLTINVDGSYSYTPDLDIQAIGAADEFTYRLEHPNGTTSDATLTIEVEHGDGPYTPPVEFIAFGLRESAADDVIAFDHIDDGNSDADASDIEFPEPSLSGDFALEDGEDDDMTVQLDGLVGETEPLEDAVLFVGRDDQERETLPQTPPTPEVDVDPFMYLQTSSVDDPEQTLSTHQSVM